MSELRDGLKAEICFWQELMNSSGLAPGSQEYRRMENALALAKQRLLEHEQWLSEAVAPFGEH